MQRKLNREIKGYCEDFTAIREILRADGAAFVEVKEQVDHYYRLPSGDDSEGTRRLKLRVEKGTGTLIYYRERQEAGARSSRVSMSSADDPGLKDVLDSALGARAIVRKRRELWLKDNVIFNLDTVEGVGQILEVEVQDDEGCDIDAQVDEYRSRLGPYLNGYITGSNEDLVAAITPPP